MVGSASTLQMAKTGPTASEALPQGGAKVWRDFMAHLRERGLVLRAD